MLLAIFAIRVGHRGKYWQWDYAIYSAAARAWAHGQNPYDEQMLYAQWRQQAHAPTTDISWLQSIVPPTTLLLISPIALVPGEFAIWFALNCAALGAIVLATAMLMHIADARAALVFAAWCLLAGPVQSGISAGQPAIIATALIVLAMLFEQKRNWLASGVLLGFAIGLKMQLAAPFLLYLLYRKSWRAAAVAITVFLIIGAAALLRLQLAGVAWLSDWLQNIHRSATNGGPNDFLTANPTRDHLLNLQLPLYAILRSRALANAGAAIIVALLIVWYLFRRKSESLDSLAPVAAITLLPIYHRYYDGTLLVIPMAWALINWRRRDGKILLALLAFFLLPVGWATNLLHRGYLPATVAQHAWWNVLVMSLQSWILLAIAVVLIAALPRRTDPATLR